jgi:hypothetical protein
VTDDAMWVPNGVDVAAIGKRVEEALVIAALATLTRNLAAAALEELRVRAAATRALYEWARARSRWP